MRRTLATGTLQVQSLMHGEVEQFATATWLGGGGVEFESRHLTP